MKRGWNGIGKGKPKFSRKNQGHWYRVFSEYTDFSLSVSFTFASYIHVLLLPKELTSEASEP
jgi:hypothetical protein